jgi:hypothetical protein
MLTKLDLGMALALAFVSQTAMAKEDVKVSFDEANRVFATIPDQANVLGLIDFCDLKETYPEATTFLRTGLAPLITSEIPEEDRKTRATFLIVTVNSYAGGVAQGLTISQAMDPKFNKEQICKEAGKIAKGLFPKAIGSGP